MWSSYANVYQEGVLKEKHEDNNNSDIYIKCSSESSAYQLIINETIMPAMRAYKVSQILSISLFLVGVSLIIISIYISFSQNNLLSSLIFGGLGTINILALIIYKPIQRIQIGLDSLITLQITCLSFLTQYDFVVRKLATKYENNSSSNNQDEQFKLANQLKEASSQAILDLHRDY